MQAQKGVAQCAVQPDAVEHCVRNAGQPDAALGMEQLLAQS
jgi:hypothetical protein